MKNLVIAALIAALSIPAFADSTFKYPCYGEKEKKLAQDLAEAAAILELRGQRETAAVQVRQKTCLAIGSSGRVGNAEYAEAYFKDSRNRAIKRIADLRGVDPLRLQAAIVDVAPSQDDN